MTRRRVRLAGLGGLAVLWLLWSGGAPAGARPSGLAHGPVEAATQSAASLELVRQTTWVHPGEAYTVDVRVTGAPAGATLALVVHDLLGSRAEFRETLDGELGGTEHAVAPQALYRLDNADVRASTLVTVTNGALANSASWVKLSSDDASNPIADGR